MLMLLYLVYIDISNKAQPGIEPGQKNRLG